MHVFRVETHRDLSSWTRILVQGCHAAAELIKEVTVGECCGEGIHTGSPLPCTRTQVSWQGPAPRGAAAAAAAVQAVG